MNAPSTRACHYCRRGAPDAPMTKDHIVPRYRVRALRLEGGHPFFALNLVPACEPCNQFKGYEARLCYCQRCWIAWDTYVILRDQILGSVRVPLQDPLEGRLLARAS